MNFKDFLKSRDDSRNINEEFRTDAEGIKQLQAKQDELYTKLRPIYSQIKELESRRNSLLYKMAGISTNLMNLSLKGEKNPELEASFKKVCEEEEKIEKELEKLYPKHDELSDEIDRNQKVLSKLVNRNAKKLVMDAYLYVSMNNLHHRRV